MDTGDQTTAAGRADCPQSAERRGEDTAPYLVSDDEHDQGWKDVTVTFRSGRTAVWRLSALPYRAAQHALQEMIETRETLHIVERCLPRDVFDQDKAAPARRPLDRLSVASAGEVEAIAFALCYGTDFQKKMERLGQEAMQALLGIPTPPDGPKSSSSAGATAKPSSDSGVSPSST